MPSPDDLSSRFCWKRIEPGPYVRWPLDKIRNHCLEQDPMSAPLDVARSPPSLGNRVVDRRQRLPQAPAAPTTNDFSDSPLGDWRPYPSEGSSWRIQFHCSSDNARATP